MIEFFQIDLTIKEADDLRSIFLESFPEVREHVAQDDGQAVVVEKEPVHGFVRCERYLRYFGGGRISW